MVQRGTGYELEVRVNRINNTLLYIADNTYSVNRYSAERSSAFRMHDLINVYLTNIFPKNTSSDRGVNKHWPMTMHHTCTWRCSENADTLTRQDKTRQREVTDTGTTVPLSPHLQCRYSDDNIHFIQLKTLINLRFRLETHTEILELRHFGTIVNSSWPRFFALAFRYCNPGIDFSIPGFGIWQNPNPGIPSKLAQYSLGLRTLTSEFWPYVSPIGECHGFSYIFSYWAHRKHTFLIIQCTSSMTCHFTCS